MLDALLQHAIAEGSQRIWCDARTPARRFYERGGLSHDLRDVDLPMIGPHVVMELHPLRSA